MVLERIVLPLVLCAFAVFALRFHTERRWSIDGYTYAAMAQMDRGIPQDRARDIARTFYRAQKTGRRPLAASVLRHRRPQWLKVFRARPLYPALAAALWNLFGWNSLLVVSGISYVAFVLLTYALALRFSNGYAAAAASAAVAWMPAVRVLANDALTDVTALALWTAALLAMCVYARTANAKSLVAVALSTIALTLTRPVFFAPLLCAVALVPRRPRQAAVIAGIAAISALAPVTLAALAHANVPFPHPYLPAAGTALLTFVKELVLGVLPAIGLAGLFTIERAPERALLTGGALASLAAVFISPFWNDAERVAVVPLLPIAACGIAALISRLSAAARKPAIAS